MIIIPISYTLQAHYQRAPLSLHLTFGAFQSFPQRIFPTYFPYRKLNSCNQMILLRGHHDQVFIRPSPPFISFLLWWILNGNKGEAAM